jgi:catechol 2,3-dioxygenase-like lactoylglutathione lyase family enzyme
MFGLNKESIETLRLEKTKMLNAVSYIMVNVTDMKRSVEFYKDRLGIPLKFESPDWTEFSTGTTTLALHGGASASQAQGGGHHVAGTCSFGFNVPDIDKTYVALKEKGVRFVMPPTARTNENIKLAVCLDPDGLSISIAQNVN